MQEERRAALEEIARERGTPCYVYFFDEVREQIAALRNTFGPAFGVSYAAKSNPNPGLLNALRSEVDTLDISSGGELELALRGGWEAERISFTGPAKREAELRAAVEHRIGEVVLESVEEAHQLNAIAAEDGARVKVLIRIAPSRVPKGFGDSMAGKPAAFGIDEEVLEPSLAEVMSLSQLDLCGFHIYSGTQCLIAESIAENYRIFIELFRRATALTGIHPEKLVFGAGIGIPYHDGQEAVDLAAVWQGIQSEVESLRAEPSFRETQLLLETGRFLVGEAGVLLTSVLRTKDSRGTQIGICDAGLNNQLAAAGHFGMIMKRNYPLEKITPSESDVEESSFQLVGPLCTSIDTFGRGVSLKGLGPGDVIAIGCSGGYGLTASPMFFISHPIPPEYLAERDGETLQIQEITRSFGG